MGLRFVGVGTEARGLTTASLGVIGHEKLGAGFARNPNELKRQGAKNAKR